MRIWLASVIVATFITHQIVTSQVAHDLGARPIATISNLFDAGSLYLGNSSPKRRAQLAAIEDIADFPIDHMIRTRAASVGMLMSDFTDKAGKVSYFNCTGSLIRPGVVVTNRHCVVHDSAALTRIDLWIEHLAPGMGRIISLNPSSVTADDKLDLAYVRLSDVETAIPSLSNVPLREAQPGEQLFILHHSKSDVLKVTRAFCRAAPLQKHPSLEFQHTCAAHPGSSGALIFAERDGAIVGLHFASYVVSNRYEGLAVPALALATGRAVASK